MKKLKKSNLAMWIAASIIFAILIHILFSIEAPFTWLEARWSAGDILTYASSVSLGLLAVWQNQRFKEENDKAQERLEKLTAQANELGIINKIIENETRKLQDAQKSFDDFCDVCAFSTISGIFIEYKDNSDILLEKMRNHIVKLNRLYAELERTVHREQTEFAQKCFSEISEAANHAESLCHFYENLKPRDTDLDYIDNYVDQYKKLVRTRTAFLTVGEERLNKVLYNRLTLEEVQEIFSTKE